MGNFTSLLNVDTAMVPAELVAETRATIAAAKSSSTRKAYRCDWSAFTAWCGIHGLVALPAAPQTLALYATSLARTGRKVSTIQRAIVAISQAHEMAGHDSPRRTAIVREALKGLRKRLGVAPVRKSPLVVEQLVQAVGHLQNTLRGALHRALLLVGFAGAFRRSELVALRVSEVRFVPEGLSIRLRRSKTDQEGRGRTVAILHGAHPETCPVRALRAWLATARIADGPLFRSVSRSGVISERAVCELTVARVVKRAALAAGAPSGAEYSGHSLRSGFATSAARAGKSEAAIMRVTGHRSAAMVHVYVREANAFRDHPGDGIGL